MSEKNDEKQKELDRREQENKEIKETGEVTLDQNRRNHKIELLTIIGEVEGHDAAPSQSKTTKYEHVLPKLAMIEDDEEIEGLLILLNTVGGDVEAGLAIAEMIASLSVPTVSLVSEFRWLYLRIILLSCRVRRWSSIRSVPAACSSALPRRTAIWKRSRTVSPVLLLHIPERHSDVSKN